MGQEAARAGATRVDEVALVIGELTSFSGDSIRFYFERMAVGTPAAGASLRIESREAVALCGGCGQSFRPQAHMLAVCPGCCCADYSLEQGNEFFIDSIETS